MGLSIVDIGKELQKYGLKVGENPAFGGVSGGHAKGSFHYAPGGQAIDVTDWRPDNAPAYSGGKPISWKQRTGELSWRAKQLGMFDEALGPGDPGHDTHVHLALAKAKDFTPQQLQWLATGRYADPKGKLTDVMPGATPAPAPDQQTLPTQAEAAAGDIYNYFYFGGGSRKKNRSEGSLLSSDFLKNYMSSMLQPQNNSLVGSLAQALNTPATF
jgi:hypothetical protein